MQANVSVITVLPQDFLVGREFYWHRKNLVAGEVKATADRLISLGARVIYWPPNKGLAEVLVKDTPFNKAFSGK